jgi:small-conductance mechanosensitive channel
MDGIVESLKPYLNVLLIGAGGIFLAFVSSQLVTRLFSNVLGAGWSRFIGSLVGLGIVIWTIKLILDTAGAAGIVVVLVTALTAAFAIGSERIAADLVSGVSLFFSRPFQVGDIVSVAGRDGKVLAISIIQTTLESVFGDQIYIRNSDVVAGTIVNYSAAPGHLISTILILPAKEDPARIVQVIENAVKNFSPELTGSAYHPSVLVESSGPGFFKVEVRAYVPEQLDYSSERTRLFLRATSALKESGLSLIP